MLMGQIIASLGGIQGQSYGKDRQGVIFLSLQNCDDEFALANLKFQTY